MTANPIARDLSPAITPQEFDQSIQQFLSELDSANKRKDTLQVANILKDLGETYLKKREYHFATKLLNGALAFCQNPTEQEFNAKKIVFIRLIQVEKNFLEHKCGIPQNKLEHLNSILYITRRKHLESLRVSIRHKLTSNHPIPLILKEYSNEIKIFLANIIKHMHPILGEPPCKFAMISLGSLARDEMSPFSDLEFALLIEKSTDLNLKYFRNWVKWLELQVICLRETAFNIIDMESPVVSGFSFDSGGNTPLGKEGQVELIKTPDDLAKLQSEKSYDEDLILANTLKGAAFLYGEESLFKQYQEKISVTSNSSVGLERALQLLSGHLKEFNPRKTFRKDKFPRINVKKDLYRLLSFSIAALADYFGITLPNTWDKIDTLVKLGVLNETAKSNLKRALESIMRLRIQCHLHYMSECDSMYHRGIPKDNAKLKNVYILTDHDVEEIVSIHRVIFPLHRLCREVCLSKDFKKLQDECFYDQALLSQAKENWKSSRLKAAQDYCRLAIAINSNDIESQLLLIEILIELCEHNEALYYIDKVQDQTKELYDRNAEMKALFFRGIIFHDSGEYNRAIEIFDRVLRDYKNLAPLQITECLTRLGFIHLELENLQKARFHFDEAQSICEKENGKNHASISICQVGNAKILLGSGQYIQAIQLIESALKITKSALGEEHPETAYILENLGIAYKESGEAKKAYECHFKGFRILGKLFGREHSNTADCMYHLGDTWYALGDVKKAKLCLNDAIQLKLKTCRQDHPVLAKYYLTLGIVLKEVGDINQAITYFEKSVGIRIKTYGPDHPIVAESINELGAAKLEGSKKNDAFDSLQEALRIYEKAYGKDHAALAYTLENIGNYRVIQGDKADAVQLQEKALALCIQHYGSDHFYTARAQNFLGNTHRILREPSKAIELHEKALIILLRHYGDQHLEVAKCLYYMGLALSTSGQKGKALAILEQALEIFKKHLESKHPKIIEIEESLRSL